MEDVRRIYLITHAQKLEGSPGSWKADPGMTEDGKRAVARLRPRLERELEDKPPAAIYAGTGRRQWEVAEALGFTVEQILFSAILGEAATAVNTDLPRKQVLLGHGLVIEWEQYLSIKHCSKPVREAILEMPDRTVICSGRPVLVRLGLQLEKCRSGALYQIGCSYTEVSSISLLCDSAQLPTDEGAKV
ncbi:MAG: hypothetical protein PHI63_06490 [Patescibacteria group bacterium]|nr:hypothetical protein [Patescibacteria group bacterium]